jgi:hypothetical protein
MMDKLKYELVKHRKRVEALEVTLEFVPNRINTEAIKDWVGEIEANFQALCAKLTARIDKLVDQQEEA